METILGFFSDLILFTAGLAVATMWLIFLIIVLIEIWDLIADFLKEDIEEPVKKAPGTDRYL